MPVNFTVRTINALKIPSGKKQVEYWDESTPGFGLRLSSGGTNSWIVRFKVRKTGEVDRENLGELESLSLTEARSHAKEYLLAASRGENLKRKKEAAIREQQKKKAEEERTFSWLVDEYVTSKKDQGNRYLKEEERMLRRECIQFWQSPGQGWGDKPMQEITRQDIEALLKKTLDRTLQPSLNPRRGTGVHANRLCSVIKRIFNFAYDKEYLEKSPCERIKKPIEKEKTRDRVLSMEEIARLWRELDVEAARTSTGNLISSILKLQLLTAQRGGEVRGIAWSEIDLQQGIWEIPGSRTKNGHSHIVPLSQQAKAIFSDLLLNRAASPWVFPGRGDPLKHVNNIQKAVQRFRKRTEIEYVAHDFRRSAATHMAVLGIGHHVIKMVLNHIDGKDVTAIYNRYEYLPEKTMALQKWADYLFRVILKNDLNLLPTAKLTNSTQDQDIAI